MSAHALGKEWLNDPLEWDDVAKAVDSPLLPGVLVRIQERKVIQWDERPRMGYNIWIGKNAPAHYFVMSIGEGKSLQLYCADHNDECLCKKLIRRFRGDA